MFSIWEKKYFLHYDFIVIGSGIVGLSSAYFLKLKHPNAKVLVLERGLMPTGASTKNAGFACMGSMSEIVDDLKTCTEEEILKLFMLRKKGLERLITMIGKENMGFCSNGSYEIIFKKEESLIEKIEYCNQFLYKEIRQKVFRLHNEKIIDFGFKGVEAIIENLCEGELDTGMLMHQLIQLVLKLGIEIKTGCEVESIIENSHSGMVVCKNPLGVTSIEFSASKIFVCTNAFAKTLLPKVSLQPGRGQVLLTKPIKDLKFKGIFHFEEGYYYFREYHGAVLFGGGRNEDFETETTTKIEINESIQTSLIQKLENFILPNQAYEIEMQWAGIMAFGATKKPIIEQFSPSIFIGVRMGGMGVAIGSEVGFQLANFS